MVDLNKAMYDVLVVGMITSSLLYLAGLALFFYEHSNVLSATFVHYASIGQFIQDLMALQSTAVLMLATIVLIATPIARVFVSIWVFAANHDRKFTLLTLIVFSVLLASIILGYFGNFTPS